ncbi:MAG: hypothetical protein IKT57_03165 [Clostridia bacterium]|nr:hypothetical protein [Clostridia bacterium]
MRLFHVSEEANIDVFLPRLPARQDLDPGVGLVWAIDEKHLPNFLTPRNCPRVCFHDWAGASDTDRKRFLPMGHPCGIVLENAWRSAMESTVLYVYEFDPEGFVLQDANAGYYVSTKTETPVACCIIPNPLTELLAKGADVHFEDLLWSAADAVRQSTLQWSLCRMGYARQRF